MFCWKRSDQTNRINFFGVNPLHLLKKLTFNVVYRYLQLSYFDEYAADDLPVLCLPPTWQLAVRNNWLFFSLSVIKTIDWLITNTKREKETEAQTLLNLSELGLKQLKAFSLPSTGSMMKPNLFLITSTVIVFGVLGQLLSKLYSAQLWNQGWDYATVRLVWRKMMDV